MDIICLVLTTHHLNCASMIYEHYCPIIIIVRYDDTSVVNSFYVFVFVFHVAPQEKYICVSEKVLLKLTNQSLRGGIKKLILLLLV